MDNSTGSEPAVLNSPIPYKATEKMYGIKPFIKDSVTQLVHISLPFSFKHAVMRMCKKVHLADAFPEIDDFLLLAYDSSPWRSELYLSVIKEVTEAENIKISGTFLSKAFDGPYQSVPKWIEEMEKYVS